MSNQTSLKLQLLRLLLTLAPKTRTVRINVNRLVHEQFVTMLQPAGCNSFNDLILKDKCWCQTLKLCMFNVIQTIKLILIEMYLYSVCYSQDCLQRSFTETRNFHPKQATVAGKTPVEQKKLWAGPGPEEGTLLLMASGLKSEQKGVEEEQEKKDQTNLLPFHSQFTNTQRQKKLACDWCNISQCQYDWYIKKLYKQVPTLLKVKLFQLFIKQAGFFPFSPTLADTDSILFIWKKYCSKFAFRIINCGWLSFFIFTSAVSHLLMKL